MPTYTINNTRIAKNTFFMYLRTLITMCISLYTSRVILRTLGEVDFGIYNVVGGVIVLFSFINGAMTSATQRHLSYELGKETPEVSSIFSACLMVHFVLSVIVLVLAETVGLWFVNTQLNIPSERMNAALWVYQFSIICCIIAINRVPFDSSIIAHEKFTFYAYSGIIESVLKLVIVFILVSFSADKLIVYSILICCVTIIMTVMILLYNRFAFPDIRLVRVKDRKIYKNIVSFSGWTIFGSFANMARHQGISIVNNIFYGVVVNAAIGVAQQVNGTIDRFVSSFQLSFNPQLTKAQANGDRQAQSLLIVRSSKFSYFILLILTCPVILNLEYILHLWLGEFPQYTTEICVFILIASLIDCLSGPLWVTVFASGKIKYYQIVISIVILLNIVVAIICGKLHWEPQYVYAGMCFINTLSLIVRLYYAHKEAQLSVSFFLKKSLQPVALVTLVAGLPSVLLIYFLGAAQNFITLLWQTVLIVLIVIATVWLLGLTSDERNKFTILIKGKLRFFK